MDHKTAAHLLRQIRWSRGLTCPYCSADHIHNTGADHKPEIRRYHCLTCNKRFNDLTGTAIQSSHLHLPGWFYVLRTNRQHPDTHYKHMATHLPVSGMTIGRIVRAAANCPVCQQITDYLVANDPRETQHQMLLRHYIGQIDPPFEPLPVPRGADKKAQRTTKGDNHP